MSEETDAVLAFSACPGIGSARYAALLSRFGSAAAAWHASAADIASAGMPASVVSRFATFRNTFDCRAYRARLAALSVTAIPYGDPRYPYPLAAISDPPILLYVKGRRKGNLADFSRTVAVVGTRKPSRYGIEMTARIVSGLVAAGCPVVSGMALGIDAVAHETAIAAGGTTLAVLGSGADIPTPATNTHIYRELSRGDRGAVISEMPLSYVPDRWAFPLRNRIISGLSRAVVVIEGAADSGTLITARIAADQGRDVFAVPGPVTSPMSAAPNLLIKNGAGVATGATDILDALGVRAAPVHGSDMPPASLSGRQSAIVSLLVARGPTHIDDIASATGSPVSAVLSDMTVLELVGAVVSPDAGVYAVRPA